MTRSKLTRSPGGIGALVLLATVIGSGGLLAAWKGAAIQGDAAASANQPEPMEVVTAATASPREHRPSTTSVGTVLALQSVTLRNELPGTVRHVALTPGRIVEPGAVLVALDVSVELADLKARQAQLALAQTTLQRLERLVEQRAVSLEEVDRARAERDVAQAEIARIKAIIDRKTVRAPFRARVGLADVHPGQYLSEGTVLTTLQGVADASHVDFTVAQNVAAQLRVGDSVFVSATNESTPVPARIVAIDARVDPTTRNALVRARLKGEDNLAGPGASVRVRVPVGQVTQAVVVPVSAVRKGPGGDHVFVIAPDDQGKPRAHLRPVQAGDVLGDSILILSGIEPGDQVASSGAFKLREGVLVAIAEQSAQQANGSR
ncbi:MAG TPA: efflux RND transporter periplasmic adaptor subunit [Gemmatimonadales bacterium]|nr:efflux RND transporter periplasmic adaptor subunit [Gemmatimonadales bacterium]